MHGRTLLLLNPVNPVRTGLTVSRGSRFPPIALGIVPALTPSSWRVELADENWQPFVDCRDADLVGITAYLENGDTLAHAQQIAAHESTRTTKLYDRTSDHARRDGAYRHLATFLVLPAARSWSSFPSCSSAGRSLNSPMGVP